MGDWPKRFLSLLTILVWAGLALFVVRAIGKLPDWKTWQAYANAETYLAMAAYAGLFCLAMLFRGLRFGLFAKRGSHISWKDVAIGFPMLFMLGAITPFRLGEGYRALWIKKHNGSGVRMAGYLFAERMTDLIFLCVLFILGLSFSPELADHPAKPIAVFLILAGCGVYAGLWLASFQVDRLTHLASGLSNVLGNLVRAFGYMRDLRFHGGVLGLTLAIWSSMALAFWAAMSLLQVSPEVGFAGALCCLGAVNLAGLLSAAPGNVGSFQAAMIGALLLFHVDAETAFIVSIVIQAANLLPTLILGGVSILLERLSGQKSR